MICKGHAVCQTSSVTVFFHFLNLNWKLFVIYIYTFFLVIYCFILFFQFITLDTHFTGSSNKHLTAWRFIQPCLTINDDAACVTNDGAACVVNYDAVCVINNDAAFIINDGVACTVNDDGACVIKNDMVCVINNDVVCVINNDGVCVINELRAPGWK